MSAEQQHSVLQSVVSSALAAYYEQTSNNLRQEFKQQITEVTGRLRSTHITLPEVVYEVYEDDQLVEGIKFGEILDEAGLQETHVS